MSSSATLARQMWKQSRIQGFQSRDVTDKDVIVDSQPHKLPKACHILDG
jgi:hypothetical protein